MDQIIKFIEGIFPDQFTAALVIIMILVIFWVHKESKANYIDKNKARQMKIEQISKAYMELDLEIDSYITGQSSFLVLIQKFANNSAVLPYEGIQRYQKLKSCMDEADRIIILEKFQKEFQSVVLNLKNYQEDASLGSSKMDALQFVEDYIKSRLAPFIMPMIYTCLNFSILVILASIVLVLNTNNGSILLQIQFLSDLGACFLGGAVAFIVLNEGIFNKRFKKPILDLLILAIFLVLSVSIYLFWDFRFSGFVVIILTVIYMLVSIKWSLKKIEI